MNAQNMQAQMHVNAVGPTQAIYIHVHNVRIHNLHSYEFTCIQSVRMQINAQWMLPGMNYTHSGKKWQFFLRIRYRELYMEQRNMPRIMQMCM